MPDFVPHMHITWHSAHTKAHSHHNQSLYSYLISKGKCHFCRLSVAHGSANGCTQGFLKIASLQKKKTQNSTTHASTMLIYFLLCGIIWNPLQCNQHPALKWQKENHRERGRERWWGTNLRILLLIWALVSCSPCYSKWKGCRSNAVWPRIPTWACKLRVETRDMFSLL